MKSAPGLQTLSNCVMNSVLLMSGQVSILEQNRLKPISVGRDELTLRFPFLKQQHVLPILFTNLFITVFVATTGDFLSISMRIGYLTGSKVKLDKICLIFPDSRFPSRET